MIHWEKYRAVLFDADDTLFDFNGAEAEAFHGLAVSIGLQVPLEEAYAAYRCANAQAWRDLEAGLLDFASLKVARFQALFSRLGVERDAVEASRTYLALLARSARLLPGAREVLESLSGRLPLALVTNGLREVQRGRIEGQGLEPFFRCILISEEIGIAKPDPAFFREACRRLEVEPAAALCVGDNPVADIRGAMDAGLDACWCDFHGRDYPPTLPRPTCVIHGLSELL